MYSTIKSSSTQYSHSNKEFIMPHSVKSNMSKSKNIVKLPRYTQKECSGNSWTNNQKKLLVRHLLRVLSHNARVQKCFYEYISRQIQKNPKNVYNFHLKLLSIYKSNQNIISQILGDQFVRQKYFKLNKTQSDLDFLLFDIDSGVVQSENYHKLDSFMTSQLSFMQAISMLEKTPDWEFDNLQSIEVFQQGFESYREHMLYEGIQIEWNEDRKAENFSK